MTFTVRSTLACLAEQILFRPLFRSSTERTWSIAARDLACGQKDAVKMIVQAIELERGRCVALLQAAGGTDAQIPGYLIDPNLGW